MLKIAFAGKSADQVKQKPDAAEHCERIVSLLIERIWMLSIC